MGSHSNLPLNFHRDRTERQINARLEELLQKLTVNRPSEDPWLVRRAFDIAAERHRDQFRSSGEPYVTHLLEVAHILSDMKLDATTLAAALLHDAIEDTEYPVSRLAEREPMMALVGSGFPAKAGRAPSWRLLTARATIKGLLMSAICVVK